MENLKMDDDNNDKRVKRMFGPMTMMTMGIGVPGQRIE